jgi:hypothetical protein
MVSGTFKKLSYQSGTGIRSKADFCLVYDRYERGISQVSYKTGSGIRLVLLQVIPD